MKKIFPSLLLTSLLFTNAFAQQFKASYSKAAFDKPFTGNVVLYLSKENKTPKDGGVGLEAFPCFSISVKNVQPGSVVLFDDKAVSYPTPLSDIERGEYYVQIVWDRNLGGRSIAESRGNLYNASEKIMITKDTKKVFSIVATQVIADPVFKETQFAKELKAPSLLLSSFHKKEMTVDAAVLLPKEYYEEPARKFPVLFMVSGYGGDYHRYSSDNNPAPAIDSIPFIRVFLDGNCSLGHSAYANSDNNGPWGDALTTEFIPQLEKQFRCNGARLLTGHSSGGWSVLWLQTQYPKVFDACWSSSPDPVDFRNFQQINLYSDKNMFYGKDSSLRLFATIAGRIPWGTQKNAFRMEHVVYRGEQMHSFDAVFSKKGADGKPESICDFNTGEINPDVAEHWKNHDISLYLRNNWDKIKTELDGKVRVSVGKQDNFLLNYAVEMLEAEMKKLNAGFQFAYYPGDHFTVSTPESRKAGYDFLIQKYREWLSKNGADK